MDSAKQPTKHIKIFLSSTFNDMHAERDIIMNQVYPAVSHILSSKNITTQFIDLRWGVNTQDAEENERENTVLRECISEIRSSRPFFIGLLGNRYGWIPSEENWRNVLKDFSEEELNYIAAETSSPKSVTELEMLFGALQHGNFLRRSIFCLRDEEVYQKMDEESLKKYSDTDEKSKEKLAALKTKIIHSYQGTGFEKNLYQYTCNWDGNKITDLDNLAVFLSDAIVKEVMLYECSEENINPENEYQRLHTIDLNTIEKNAEVFIGRETLLAEIPQLFSEKMNTVILGSRDGHGKTGLISQCYNVYGEKDNVLTFVHFSDKKGINQYPETMLKKWLADERVTYDKRFLMQQEVDFQELVFHFKKAVSSLDKKIILLIDDIHLLKTTDNFLDFSWIPENASLIATADSSWQMFPYGPECIEFREMPGITVEEAQAITEKHLKSKGKKLPSAVMKALLNHSYEGVRSSSSLLWIRLMVRRLTTLSIEDYNKIKERLENDEALKIQNYLIEVVNNSHPHPEPLFLSLIEFSPYLNQSNFIWHILKFVAATENGIRETDLQALLKDTWDSLTFTGIKSWLGDLIKIDSETGLIDFAYEGYRIMLRLPEESMAPYYQALANYTISLINEDSTNLIGNVEIPYLVIKLNDSEFIKNFSTKERTAVWMQMINAAAHYFFKNKEYFLDWYKKTIHTDALISLRLSFEVAKKMISMHRQGSAVELIEVVFLTISDEHKNSYEANRCRLMLAELIKTDSPEFTEEIIIDFINNNLDKKATDARYIPLVAKASTILADLFIARDNFKDAYEYISFAELELEDMLLNDGTTEHVDELKKVFEIFLSVSEKTIPDKCDDLKKYYKTYLAAEKWMFSHYSQIEQQLQQAGFTYFSNNNFCSDLLFNQALKQAEELTLYAPDNILFLTKYIYAKLCRYRVNDKQNNHTKEIESDFDRLAHFATEETEDLSAQCLLYLHQTDAESYPREFVVKYLEENFNLDNMMKSANPKTLATLYQIIVLFKLNPDKFFKDTEATLFLEVAEHLLLSRNDIPATAYFIRRYNDIKKENQPSDVSEIKLNVLQCLIASKETDFNKIFDYYDVVKTFMKAIPTLQSFIAVNDFLRIWSVTLQSSAHIHKARLAESFQIFKDVLNAVNNAEENYAYLLRAQLCFYNFCSQADYNMLPFLREGRLEEAEQLLKQLQDSIRQIKKLGHSNRLVLTGFSLAYNSYSAYYEETRAIHEALYWSRMMEYTVFENYQKYPDDWELKRRYAAALDNTGRLFMTYLISLTEAENCFNTAFILFQELYKEKKSGVIVNDLLISAHNLMQTLHRKKEYDKAIQFTNNFFETLDINDNFVELRILASLYDDLSDNYIALKKYEKAHEILLKSQEIFINQLQKEPENELYLRDFAQNGIRLGLFLWEKRNNIADALQIMRQVDEKIQKAGKILNSSMKIRQIDIYFQYRYSQMLIACNQAEQAVPQLNIFINLCYHEIKNENNLPIVPLFWDGINLNFNEAIQKGYIDIASNLTGIELKLKKEFIQNKIMKEEDALLYETMQKIEILEKIKQMDNRG